MDRVFIGAFEVGDKKPSEMSEEELNAWADALADKIVEAAKAVVSP